MPCASIAMPSGWKPSGSSIRFTREPASTGGDIVTAVAADAAVTASSAVTPAVVSERRAVRLDMRSWYVRVERADPGSDGSPRRHARPPRARRPSAAQAEQREHSAEVDAIDRDIRLSTNDGLGTERDAECGSVEHAEIV